MAEIKDRVIEYLKTNGITKQDFCKETGISYANMVGNSLKSELGGEQIALIFMKYPNINPDWLMLGKGEMLRDSVHDEPDSATLDRLLNKISDLAQELGRVQAENAELKKELAQRDNTVVDATASVASA